MSQHEADAQQNSHLVPKYEAIPDPETTQHETDNEQKYRPICEDISDPETTQYEVEYEQKYRPICEDISDLDSETSHHETDTQQKYCPIYEDISDSETSQDETDTQQKYRPICEDISDTETSQHEADTQQKSCRMPQCICKSKSGSFPLPVFPLQTEFTNTLGSSHANTQAHGASRSVARSRAQQRATLECLGIMSLDNGYSNLCSYCTLNQQPWTKRLSHMLYDPQTLEILCPDLRAVRCKFCGATGGNAHQEEACLYLRDPRIVPGIQRMVRNLMIEDLLLDNGYLN